MARLGLVDLVTLVLVASSVLGALAARRGVIGALLSGLGTALGCWLICLGLLAFAPAPLADAASSSVLLHLVPVPGVALEQARSLGHWLVGQLGASLGGATRS